MKSSISLTPHEVSVLTRCPLHYYFLQQHTPAPAPESTQANIDERVRKAINHLHAKGGPARLPLEKLLEAVGNYPQARKMVENYYQRLQQDWPRVMAANEDMSIKISIGGVGLLLHGVIDRLDKTRDGGILAIQFCTANQPLPAADDLRQEPATTIYHLLTASTYPLKRPVRFQQLWLYPNQDVTIELSEEEYRHNLGNLQDPVRALARNQTRARPGLHCDTCPFKENGCPVYPQTGQTENIDFDLTDSDGKIQSRNWIFND